MPERQKGLFYRDFLRLEPKNLGNSISTFRVTQVCIKRRRLLPIVATMISKLIRARYAYFPSVWARYRPLPIVFERRELVGPLGLEPRTKGFTSAPPFPEGVDYLFTPVGCGTL